MKLTVAICTWNRADLLRRTLGQFTHILPPNADWELIVVDNNCTDETGSVLDSFAQYLPLRRVFESRQGLSNARNAVIAHATGDYILWTDDDVLVDSEWIVAYERAFSRWPDAAIFGGPIRPWFEGSPPEWLLAIWNDVAIAYAAKDIGLTCISLESSSELPFGANFAVRTQEQQAFLYNCDKGRKLNGGCVGEETEVISAILQAGGKGWWIPDAQVRHWVPKDKQTIDYIRAYYDLHGKALRRLTADAPKLLGHPRWVWRKALEAEIAYRAMRLTGNPAFWVRPLIDASICWGIIRGA